MLSDDSRQEIVEIIGEERAAQIEQGVVERHRQLHSDAQMWAMLTEREERMASLLKTIGKLGTMLSVGSFSDKESKMWRGQIDRFSREYAGHVEFCDSLIWHMGKRGLLDPANWREGWQDYLNVSALEWWGVN
jgi:hypothetical protein